MVGCQRPPTPGCVPIATTGNSGGVGMGVVTSLVYAQIQCRVCCFVRTHVVLLIRFGCLNILSVYGP